MSVSIQVGDVFWSRFPLREAPGKPGNKIRPALILGYKPAATPRDDNYVLCAYGTSQAARPIKAWELVVQLPGTSKITIIDCSRRAVLPVTEDYFPDFERAERLGESWYPMIKAALMASKEADRLEGK